MALKPRNLDWLNICERFSPDFQWPKGRMVLNFCNFVILLGLAGTGAQWLFRIPQLTERLAVQPVTGFDPTLLVFAGLSYLVLWTVRWGVPLIGAVILIGLGGYVVWRFAVEFFVPAWAKIESLMDVVLLPFTLGVGILIAAVFWWSGVLVARSGITNKQTSA